jgi:hypothetical protein
MTARHRVRRTALWRQGGLSPELKTWISGLAAIERARPRHRGSAGPVMAELDGLLALEPLIAGDAAAQASSALDLGPDDYVRAPRSTLLRARDLLERLSSGLNLQVPTGPSLPASAGGAGPTVGTASPGVLCVLAGILSFGPRQDGRAYTLADAERVVAELAKAGWEIKAIAKGPNDLAPEP